MKQHARAARADGRTVGLVPTMGALHEGHLSLIRRAKQECSHVVASIFINPKQFGPAEDLARYPRTFDADAQKLAAAGVNSVFVPEPPEIYPAGFSTYVHVEGLSERLEGKSRPGHFRGVSTVVMKLVEIVQPDFAYFGRKDAQQTQVIRRMAEDLNLDAQIVVCPIVREPDGLALSSRNVYLDPRQRQAATVLYRALLSARQQVLRGERSARALETALSQVLDTEPLVRTDYAKVVDAGNFEPVEHIGGPAFALIAAFLGTTRLIDNMLIEPAGPGALPDNDRIVSL
jgi:pantoate--beta-alanine ligase